MTRSMIHVTGLLLLHVGAIILLNVENPCTKVEAYEIVFSTDLTTDFAKGSIDVPSLIRQDWLTLPLIGFCGLASKFSTAHKFDTSTIRGTFYTTFEYLTQDCTAEYKRDNNTCALLTAAFAVCLGFPLDRRTCNHPWGYCSNFNFRLSYMWVPNVTLPGLPKLSNLPAHQLQSSTSELARSGNSDPAALATIHQDIESLREASVRASATGGRLDTGCDWRYSSLVPVAWDGVQNVLTVGQSLQSPDSTYNFIMQQDCNLVLYKKGADGKYEFNARWASYSHFNDPFFHNCSTVLQPNGNLVVLDPWGFPRWSSNSTTPSWYTSALAVLRNGSVAVYEMNSGTVLWSTS
ncbi:hypothetical protein M758_12G015500 [Ceratodon purpureus]|nr:hypothetical protein M758_12G015500 [Ceratodon purpureus]